MPVELNSQLPALIPALGRRPSAMKTSRGTHILTTVTVWTGAVRISATRSVPLSVSVRQDISMIKAQTVARHAAVVINILAQMIPMSQVAVARPVAENIRLVLVQVHILGGMELVVARVLIVTDVLGQVMQEVVELLVMDCTVGVDAKVDMFGIVMNAKEKKTLLAEVQNNHVAENCNLILKRSERLRFFCC